jgi:hypothetical protein
MVTSVNFYSRLQPVMLLLQWMEQLKLPGKACQVLPPVAFRTSYALLLMFFQQAGPDIFEIGFHWQYLHSLQGKYPCIVFAPRRDVYG